MLQSGGTRSHRHPHHPARAARAGTVLLGVAGGMLAVAGGLVAGYFVLGPRNEAHASTAAEPVRPEPVVRQTERPGLSGDLSSQLASYLARSVELVTAHG